MIAGPIADGKLYTSSLVIMIASQMRSIGKALKVYHDNLTESVLIVKTLHTIVCASH